MADPGTNAAHALKDGTARVMAAPAVLLGIVGLALLLGAPAGASLLGPGAAAVNGFLKMIRSSITIGLPASAGLGVLLLWPFLTGGLLDRYARNRPTRGRGFFGACGAHFAAMVRLAVLAWLIYGAIVLGLGRAVGGPYGRGAIVFLTLAAALVVSYASVRLVVEDRRSAIGALLAGARFTRRNPGSAGAVFLVYVLLIAALDWLCADLQILPAAAGWRAYLGALACAAIRWVFVLALYAWETALFQSRLAHASYTAAPSIEWPDSPAAESIANASPAMTP